MISIIAIMSRNNVIGRGGDMPPELESSADKQRFAKITKSGTKTVIAGRKTEESIERRLGQPLPGRQTIVVTRDPSKFEGKNVWAFSDPFVLIDWAKAKNDEVFVIGGAEIYKLFLPHADKMYITRLDRDIDGDAFFPEWDPAEWEVAQHGDVPNETPPLPTDFEFIVCRRKLKRRPQHLGNTRYEDQRQKMLNAAAMGECVFCYDHLKKYHESPVTWEGDHWVLTANDYQYDHTRIHLLAISRKHVENIGELDPKAGTELIELVQRLSAENKIEGGALFMRFGDENFSGGTIPHLHAHIVVPDVTAGDYQPVPCWVGARRND